MNSYKLVHDEKTVRPYIVTYYDGNSTLLYIVFADSQWAAGRLAKQIKAPKGYTCWSTEYVNLDERGVSNELYYG